METITSRRNPLVRLIRSLHRPEGRLAQGSLLLEGTHLLEEALRRDLVPERVLATDTWIRRHGDLLRALPAAVPVHPVSSEVIETAATTRHPDGVLLTLRTSCLPGTHPRRSNRAGERFILALDRLQDPGNLGTLMRTGLAAGITELWLADGADPFQPKVVRASSGAALALPVVRMEPVLLRDRLRQAREQGLQLVAAVACRQEADGRHPAQAARPYWELDWSRATVLLMGNEGSGLAADLEAMADHRLTVPHDPSVESLNVAVAAAPLLLERYRQITLAGS